MSVTYTNFVGGIVTENRGGVTSHYVADTLGSTIALVNATPRSHPGTVTTHTRGYHRLGPLALPFNGEHCSTQANLCVRQLARTRSLATSLLAPK
jgi:hypothetical protein